MIRRSGVTLIEVLVSIFVTAIGLLALLALFPVGAFSMANAIKNGRCVQASINANAIATCSAVNLGKDTSDTAVYSWFDAKNINYPASMTQLPALTAGSGKSYPVCVDPIGTGIPAAGFKSIGQCDFSSVPTLGYVSPGIPRTTTKFITNSTLSFEAAIRFLSIGDDMSFDLNGSAIASVGTVERERRYSWIYMLRQPLVGSALLIDRSIGVYGGRPAYVRGETAYGPVQFVAGLNSVQVTWIAGQEKPAIKNGTWILDATVIRPDTTPGQPPGSYVAEPGHGYFYRVVSVSDAGPNTLQLELQTPVQVSTVDPTRGAFGVLVVVDNLVEVFDKPSS